MIKNKTQTATFAVMFAAIAWSIFTTASCVVIDHKKHELEKEISNCRLQNNLLQMANNSLKQDTAWMKNELRRDMDLYKKMLK